VVNQSFPFLGYGLGFRSCHYNDILTSKPKSIDWLEVITENFLDIGGKPRRILEEARSNYPVALHGVGLSIGSPDPLSTTYLSQFKNLIDWLNPCLISDHLCFTKFNHHNTHDLLPVEYSRDVLARISDRIDQIQQLIGRRFMLENPSAYVAYASQNQMPEFEFLSQLVEKTSCGILLDVNNVFVNQMNLGLDPIQYLKHLPTNCVGQIHLAGHSIQTNELGTVRIDTHDHPVNPEVWELLGYARHKWPNASPMIEWDDHIPELSELISMLDFARNQFPKPLPNDEVKASASYELIPSKSPDTSHQNLFSMAVDPRGIDANDSRLVSLSTQSPVSELLGARVYNNAYFCRLRDVLKDSFPTLAGVTTEDGFNDITVDYLNHYPPSEFDIGKLGQHLASHLARNEIPHVDFGVPQQVLAEITSLDAARTHAFLHQSQISPVSKTILNEITSDQWNTITFQFTPTLQILSHDYNITPIWTAIEHQTEASIPEKIPTHVAVWRDDESSVHKSLSTEEHKLMVLIQKNISFANAASQIAEAKGETLESTTSRLIQYLITWFDLNLIVQIET
jgi:uncharacterized protein (UPF0276 family)